ncbi:NO-inducible flavohemoprotein [Deinococcus psychrotolerans]|uniref:Flavohemoprotein n=1 Tax=Deinococcus psychrotolerans TaxID=2489213 RepID=A0A3G8Y9I2_9DEIO|nr:NO-inducible flavohemoprotein [Deinococcus psychrotolerans]AZI41815.1 NO-inducible flavohemoprotein [Deinococcus psychrotolerans]
MLTPSQTAIIKATVPALELKGEEITRHFYSALFAAHPELLNVFNPANQATGRQARSLAASVLAYAAHIENPAVLGPMLSRITNKHVSLDVLPEQYPVVGHYLLEAIATVLGDAATPAILDAWAAAYGQLADLMMGAEQQIYDADAAQVGGWRGFKVFRVIQKAVESQNVTSLILEPADGQPLPPYRAGQYLSVKAQVPGFPTQQIRQYSLSDASNQTSYRISVKREFAPSEAAWDAPEGLISNYLHDQIEVGAEVLVHLPAGDFYLQDTQLPVVLLSGGVGITPMLSMLNTLIATGSKRPVVFVHAALSQDFHAFRAHVNELAAQHPQVRKVIYYTDVTDRDRPGEHHDLAGLISLKTLRPYLPEGQAEYYYCGPEGFVSAAEGMLDQLGIPAQQRFTETFGPTQTAAPALS